MKRATHPTWRQRGQRGIALIEAMVAILIFAFGVLGLIGLQASMTQAQTSAKFRADAALLAADLQGLVQTDAIGNAAQYGSNNCAAYARCADWRRKVDTILPQAQVNAVVNVGTGATIDVTLSWQQGRQDRNSFSTSLIWVP